MAKRKQDDGGAFLLMIGAVLVGLVVIFVYPVALVGAWIFYACKSAGDVFEVPDASSFHDEAAERSVEAIRSKIANLYATIHDVYEDGDTAGARLTAASDHSRFDAKYKVGRELNDRLDDAASRVAHLDEQRHASVYAVVEQWPDWEADFLDWVNNKVTLYAMTGGVIAYVAGLVLFGAGFTAHDRSWSFYWPAFCASVVSAIAVAILRSSRKKELIAAVAEQQNAWDALGDHWTALRETVPDYAYAEQNEEPPSQANPLKSTDWSSVLNISRTASAQEIKAAYHHALKEYHPDRIASLNLADGFQALANERTQALNEAYQLARAERGF